MARYRTEFAPAHRYVEQEGMRALMCNRMPSVALSGQQKAVRYVRNSYAA